MGPVAEIAAGISGIFGLLGFIAYAIIRVSSGQSRLRLTPELVASLKHHGIPEERLAGLSDKELRTYLSNQGKLSSDLIDKIIATEVTGQQRIVLWVSTGLLILALVLGLAARLGTAPEAKSATGGTEPLGTVVKPLRREEPPQPADTAPEASSALAMIPEQTEVRPDTLTSPVAPTEPKAAALPGVLPSSGVDQRDGAAAADESVSIPEGTFGKFVFADRILPLLTTDQAQFRRLKAGNTEPGIWKSRAVVEDADDCHITDDDTRLRLVCRWPLTSNDAIALNQHDDMVNAIKNSPAFAGWSCTEVPAPDERWIIVRTICRAGTGGREPARVSVTLTRQPTGMSEVEARFTPNIP